MDVNTKEWLVSKYRIIGECWIWQKGKNRNKGIDGAYGLSRVNGKSVLAHRLSWMIYKGEIPQGLCVLHNCPGGDNRLCVNPDHLWLGTYKDNAKDAFKKGRLTKVWGRKKTQEEKDKIQKNRSIPYQKGEKQHRSKLKNEQVLEIRTMLENKVKYRIIAEKFSIDICSISDIKFRRTWKHI